MINPLIRLSHYNSLSVHFTSINLFMYSSLSSYLTGILLPFYYNNEYWITSFNSYTLLSVLKVTQVSKMFSSNVDSGHSYIKLIKLHIVASTYSISSNVIFSPTICFQKIDGKSKEKCVAVLIAIAINTPKNSYKCK